MKVKPPTTSSDMLDNVIFGGKAAKQLFFEALCHYLMAMSANHFINRLDKEILLIAIHGLCKLGSPSLARCLIRIVFTDLSCEDYLKILDDARQATRLAGCVIPF